MNRPLALALLLATSACAQETSKYPSLAVRPVELRSDEEPVTTPVAATPDATLDAKLATMAATAATNKRDFDAAATKADNATKARGAIEQGSDAWLNAQAGLAELDALHGDLLGLASDYERMATDRAQAGDPPYPTLDAAQATTQTELDAQSARIAAIKAALGEK
ncbi:MAG: hypothetical protein J0I47_03495 [Sphingomonas sp.]|uniref:hypothetical protein n=1 Tax=Sphingomonas sp. TaxID=28214 RepID=UPI001AD0AE6B|nr:hypothetical protein [Sphingomonas sp.]MBN8807291.1 hypothetical protein [Sphingomonas sp.]